MWHENWYLKVVGSNPGGCTRRGGGHAKMIEIEHRGEETMLKIECGAAGVTVEIE